MLTVCLHWIKQTFFFSFFFAMYNQVIIRQFHWETGKGECAHMHACTSYVQCIELLPYSSTPFCKAVKHLLPACFFFLVLFVQSFN